MQPNPFMNQSIRSRLLLSLCQRKSSDWKPSEDEWSIMQIITHVAEAIPYWAKEINNIKLNQEMNGGGLTDEVRLQQYPREYKQHILEEIMIAVFYTTHHRQMCSAH